MQDSRRGATDKQRYYHVSLARLGRSEYTPTCSCLFWLAPVLDFLVGLRRQGSNKMNAEKARPFSDVDPFSVVAICAFQISSSLRCIVLTSLLPHHHSFRLNQYHSSRSGPEVLFTPAAIPIALQGHFPGADSPTDLHISSTSRQPLDELPGTLYIPSLTFIDTNTSQPPSWVFQPSSDGLPRNIQRCAIFNPCPESETDTA